MTRLIDADELKKKFNERSYWTYTHEYGDAIPIGWIMSGIDNTPTADDWQKYSDELWKNAYERGKQDARTTGEWIVDEFGRKICGKCQFPFAEFQSANYCSLCGAKMGETEKSE